VTQISFTMSNNTTLVQLIAQLFYEFVIWHTRYTSLEITSQKVLKKLAYYTLLGGHSKRVVSRSEFCADSESTNSRILSLPKLKLLQKTNRHYGWVIKRSVDCAK